MSSPAAEVNYFKFPEGGILALLQPNAAELTIDRKPIQLHDVRGQEDKLNIDNAGFQYVKAPTDFQDWDDVEQIEKIYYEEIKEQVKKHFGCTTVHIDCHNRRGTTSKPTIARVHIDRTPKSSRERLSEAVGQEEQDRMNRENVPYLLMSCWRPIRTIQRDPLIMCDARTADNSKDLVDMARPLNHGAQGAPGRLYWGKYNPEHKWCYMSEQTKDDLLFIKLVDWRDGHEPVGVLHSSATLVGNDDLPPRESIEVRVVATWE